MRVAYVAHALFVSGAERSLQTTLRHLPAIGVEPLVITQPGSKLLPWCLANRVPTAVCALERRDKWHPFRWWRSVRQVRSALQSQRIDLVHANTVWSYPAAGAAGGELELPRLCHMRDEVPPEGLRWLCAAGVEGVLCISKHIERHVSPAWPAGGDRPWMGTLINPVVLPPALSADEAKRAQGEARRQFGVAEDGVVFGFIGQIVPVKGLLKLLEALAGLADDPGWQLLVVGKDPNPGAPHEAVCEENVRRLGLGRRVKFTGYVEDPTAFYRAIDLAVVPSLEEPLGRIPLEAGSHGKPSVAYAVGGLPETVRHGETGWLVSPGEVDALRAALREFLEQPSPAMGKAAREWVASVSDPHRYVKSLARVYAEVAGKSGDAAEQRLCHTTPRKSAAKR